MGWKNRWQNRIFPHHPSSIPLSFFFSSFLHRESCILSRKNGIIVCENNRKSSYYQYLAKKRRIPRYFLPTMVWALLMVCALLWRVGEGNVISRNTRAGASRARVRAPYAPPKDCSNSMNVIKLLHFSIHPKLNQTRVLSVSPAFFCNFAK